MANGQAPVTKADLESALEQFFNRIIEHVDERIYDTETKLLRAFSEYATASDVR
jgi:hypothetical protein